VRFELKLTNGTAINWATWKAIESDMTDLCIKYNVGEFNILPDDDYIKSELLSVIQDIKKILVN